MKCDPSPLQHENARQILIQVLCQVILEYIVCQAQTHTICSAFHSLTDFLSQPSALRKGFIFIY
jgi:hypothetical protein